MKGKELFGQPFGYPVKIVNFDIRYPLLPRSDIEEALQTVDIFQHTENPMQTIYIKPNLKAQGVLGEGREQRIPFCQKVRTTYIDGRRNKDFGDMFINRLYTKILDIDSQESLEQFLAAYPDFSDFPSRSEHENLMKKHPEYMMAPLEKVREINLEFLLEKISQFRQFLTKWLTRKKDAKNEDKLLENKLLWLNNELRKVSPIITGYSGYIWSGIRSERKPDAEFSKIIGMDEAYKSTPVYGYQVQGYFAFCCLELLHDMRNQVPMFVCERCGKLNAKKKGSTRTTCSRADSLSCVRAYDANRRQKHRKQ